MFKKRSFYLSLFALLFALCSAEVLAAALTAKTFTLKKSYSSLPQPLKGAQPVIRYCFQKSSVDNFDRLYLPTGSLQTSEQTQAVTFPSGMDFIQVGLKLKTDNGAYFVYCPEHVKYSTINSKKVKVVFQQIVKDPSSDTIIPYKLRCSVRLAV